MKYRCEFCGREISTEKGDFSVVFVKTKYSAGACCSSCLGAHRKEVYKVVNMKEAELG